MPVSGPMLTMSYQDLLSSNYLARRPYRLYALSHTGLGIVVYLDGSSMIALLICGPQLKFRLRQPLADVGPHCFQKDVRAHTGGTG